MYNEWVIQNKYKNMAVDNYFKNRKTIRKYSQQEVSDELLRQLISAAAEAPTTGGMQLYSVVVTRDDEMKRQLAPHHFFQKMVTDAPVVLTFCADFNRMTRWCEASDAKPCYGNFQSFMSAVLDVTIFAQQFNTAAEMAGLGCCYIGTTTYNAPQIAEVLKLPIMVIPVVTITVGYPFDAVSEYKAERLPLEAIMHDEVYCDYDDRRIKALYAEKESLEVNKRYVVENNKSTLAQVFTDVRYPKDNNEAFSKVFADFLQEHGFKIPF